MDEDQARNYWNGYNGNAAGSDFGSFDPMMHYHGQQARAVSDQTEANLSAFYKEMLTPISGTGAASSGGGAYGGVNSGGGLSTAGKEILTGGAIGLVLSIGFFSVTSWYADWKARQPRDTTVYDFLWQAAADVGREFKIISSDTERGAAYGCQAGKNNFTFWAPKKAAGKRLSLEFYEGLNYYFASDAERVIVPLQDGRSSKITQAELPSNFDAAQGIWLRTSAPEALQKGKVGPFDQEWYIAFNDAQRAAFAECRTRKPEPEPPPAPPVPIDQPVYRYIPSHSSVALAYACIKGKPEFVVSVPEALPDRWLTAIVNGGMRFEGVKTRLGMTGASARWQDTSGQLAKADGIRVLTSLAGAPRYDGDIGIVSQSWGIYFDDAQRAEFGRCYASAPAAAPATQVVVDPPAVRTTDGIATDDVVQKKPVRKHRRHRQRQEVGPVPGGLSFNPGSGFSINLF